jgi:hypothetical protein
MTSPFQWGVGLTARTLQSLMALPPGATPPTTAQTLAALLDFRGSVHLAHCLQPTPPAGPEVPSFGRPAHAPFLLGDYVRKRLGSLDPETSRRATRLPTAGELYARLLEYGAFDAADARRRAAASIARTYRDIALSTMARARTDVEALREEVVEDLRRLGGDGARLEAIDAALRSSMKAAVAEAFDRLGAALERALILGLEPAIAALPSPFEVQHVEPWLETRGVIGVHLGHARSLARTFLRRDAARLVALVDAACKGGA